MLSRNELYRRYLEMMEDQYKLENEKDYSFDDFLADYEDHKYHQTKDDDLIGY